MNGPVFLKLEMDFGRHAGSYQFPTDGPVVITGANGSGKTTLVDALLRTVYGFRRQRDDESKLLEARRPWASGPYRASVHLRTPDGQDLIWSRDFDTDGVSVRTAEGSTMLFEGEANPGGKGPATETYWNLVRSVFGFDELDDYERTACIRQGELLGTAFGGNLLTLAEGGHARVRAAQHQIEEEHKALTREPVMPGATRLRKDRRLELAQSALADTRAQLDETRHAEGVRGPTVQNVTELEAEEARLERDLIELESARSLLLKRETAVAEVEAAQERADRLVQLKADMDGAERDTGSAEGELDHRAVHGRYPDDFRTRAAELRSAFKRLDELDKMKAATRSSPWIRVAGIAGAVAVAVGGFFVFQGATVGWIGVISGSIIAGGLFVRQTLLRRARQRTGALRTEIERSVARLLVDVPNPGTLTSATLPDRLEDFERQDEARRRLADSRKQIETLARRVREIAEAAGTPGRTLILLADDAQQRLREAKSLLHGLQAALPDRLPDDVRLDSNSVDAAVGERRTRLQEVRSERQRLAMQLATSARTALGVARLEEECEVLQSRVEETRRLAEAYRAAHALIRGGYEEFREQDESRLVEAILNRIQSLGASGLAEFRSDAGLTDPTVELGGRRVALDSLELSFGERHLVQLAVRLGTADFLGTAGIAVPLVVDEPFAHLDDRHSAQVWLLLVRIADERQVIVTTQETQLLDRLGVTTGLIELDGHPA